MPLPVILAGPNLKKVPICCPAALPDNEPDYALIITAITIGYLFLRIPIKLYMLDSQKVKKICHFERLRKIFLLNYWVPLRFLPLVEMTTGKSGLYARPSYMGGPPLDTRGGRSKNACRISLLPGHGDAPISQTPERNGLRGFYLFQKLRVMSKNFEQQ
jgi:hypothetical protein